MKRRNLILALGILLSLSGVTPVYAADTEPAIVENQKSVQNGWVLYKWKEMEYWHYYIDGEMVKSQRITIDGKDYYFDGSGVMTTGMIWYMEPNGETKCIYAAEDGHIVKDRNKWFTQKRFGKESWYYFKDDSFIACDEFVTIFGKVYHFDDQARMSVGSFKVFDEQLGEYGAYVSYTADANGVVSGYPKTGWVRAGGNWYYYITEDVIAKNEFCTIYGKEYYFNEFGQMQSGKFSVYDSETDTHTDYLADENGAIRKGQGWKYSDLYWYYTDSEGRVCTEQWVEDHYYVDEEGKMLIGTYDIEGKVYRFDDNGYCQNADEYTGWRLIDGYWYYHDEEGQPVTGWVNNDTYYIQDGIMLADTFLEDDGEMYYLRYDGRKVKNGWYSVYEDETNSKSWIYADADGKLVENGWKQIGSLWYYFEDFIAADEIMEIDGYTEIFSENCAWLGTAKPGWKKVDGRWYYFNSDGTLLKGVEKKKIGGATFYFKENGEMRCNEVHTDDEADEIFYLNENGYKQYFQEWKKDKNDWYYSSWDAEKGTGSPVRGFLYCNGRNFAFSNDGKMLTGNVYVNYRYDYFFFTSSGLVENVSPGWNSDGKNWYYFTGGEAVRDRVLNINGVTYAFDESGTMRRGLYNDYLFAQNGELARNEWCLVDGIWYYADANGRYVYGERVIDGTRYWFDSYGRLLK